MTVKEEKKIRDIIRKLGLRRSGKNIYADKTPTSAEMAWIRPRKNEILNVIDMIVEEKKKKRQTEIEREAKKFNLLIKALPKFVPPKSDKDDKKAKRLLAEAKSISYYNGPESEGLNLAVDRERAKLRKEAAKHCIHDWETKISQSYTQDARRKVIRTITCKKCGWTKKDMKTEAVGSRAIRR